MARTRRLVGLLTLLTLVAIFVSVSGVELPVPRFGGGSDRPLLAGVRGVAANMLLRVGAGAPAGSQLAFMAVEQTGNLLVTDASRHGVMRFDPTGHLLAEWGPEFGGVLLTEPAGVAITGDSVYVIDRGTPRIFRLDSSGNLQGTISLQTFGTYGLNGLAIDAAGNLYAADTGRNRIIVLAPNGQLLKQIGHGGSDLGGFTQPMALAFGPDGAFYVADWENNRVERFDSKFEATDAWSVGFHAFGIAVDQTGRVFVPDADHHRVEVYTPQGAQLGEMGAPSSPIIDVSPRQVALAPTGQPSLYVLGGDGIQRLDLANTPPPPQGGGVDTDLLGLGILALMALLVCLAVGSRRQRQAVRSLRPTLDRPVGLDAKDGAEGKHKQTDGDQDLLIAYQTKREE